MEDADLPAHPPGVWVRAGAVRGERLSLKALGCKRGMFGANRGWGCERGMPEEVAGVARAEGNSS